MLTSTSLFLFFTSSLFSSFPVYGEGDIVKVKDKNDTKPSFHRLMPFFNFFKVELRDMEKKELSLVGKDNVVEKVIVKKDKSLFGKDFKVVFSFVRSSFVYPGPSTATGTHFRFNSTAISHSAGFPHLTGTKIQDKKIDDYRAWSK